MQPPHPMLAQAFRLLSAGRVPEAILIVNQLAAPGFTPSVVNDAAGRPVRDPIRTSDGSTLHWLIEDPAVHALNRRLAAATGTDAAQGEAVQILRYRPGEQYRPHFDFVRASDNQRMMTALVYLNHDYEGARPAS